MSGVNLSICLWCKHLDTENFNKSRKWRCKAFPEIIPREIAENERKHFTPYEGDNGIQFEKQSEKSLLPKLLIIGLKGFDSDITLQAIIDFS